jgi:hypothetical protein
VGQRSTPAIVQFSISTASREAQGAVDPALVVKGQELKQDQIGDKETGSLTEFAKALRWTAPGSVALFVMLGVVVLSRVSAELFEVTARSSEGLLDVDAAGLLTGAALSVPLGFVTYQIYFFFFSRPFVVWRAVRGDFGTQVLHAAGMRAKGGKWVPRRSEEPLLRFASRPRLRRLRGYVGPIWLYQFQPDQNHWEPLAKDQQAVERLYYKRVESRWARLQSEIDRCTFPGSDQMRAQLDRHADIYHTLGACRYALFIGWGSGTAWALWSTVETRLASVGVVPALATVFTASILGLIATAVLALMFHANRRHCNTRRVATLTIMLQTQLSTSAAPIPQLAAAPATASPHGGTQP